MAGALPVILWACRAVKKRSLHFFSLQSNAQMSLPCVRDAMLHETYGLTAPCSHTLRINFLVYSAEVSGARQLMNALRDSSRHHAEVLLILSILSSKHPHSVLKVRRRRQSRQQPAPRQSLGTSSETKTRCLPTTPQKSC